EVAMGGEGVIKDIVVHLPMNLVDLKCKPGSNGVNFTVLLYNQDCDSDRRYAPYPQNFLGVTGITTYCYHILNITTPLPIGTCELCDPTTHQSRKGWVYIGDPNGVPASPNAGDLVEFCCDAGFNMHVRVMKSIKTPENQIETVSNRIDILQRRYWAVPESWKIT
ncbi:MAG: hypothetical protein JXB14_06090, partial [Candidatus Altiarchaeota archaeon]|nr:hypothetical protein [Candidatus Altiarchaeota archaeon]